MFAKLRNQFKLTFNLKVDSPLCIRSGEESIDPTLPDMQCIRSNKNGESVVFIPGSSIKGVIRTQCEKIFNILAEKQIACDIFNEKSECNNINEDWKGEETYNALCPACKMFGSMSLGGRIKFKDAYPINNEFKIGYRNGVGINRITGAAQNHALYGFEVVEDGKFQVTITGDNYELYQLKILLWALDDINEGYVTFGSSSTRGNGKMLVEDVKLQVRDYRKNVTTLNGYYSDDKGETLHYEQKGYFKVSEVNNIEKILNLVKSIDIITSIKRGEKIGN